MYKYWIGIFCMLFSFFTSHAAFIKTRNIFFINNNKPYYYIGTNYWYGGYLYNNNDSIGKKRLNEELDYLVKSGITNLRVFISSEGDSTYKYRVYPSIQEEPGKYNEALLVGFDYFLVELKKRNMKAIMVLNNNWEWSGGFGTYLEWAGYKNQPLPKTILWDWDMYCKYISRLYTCKSCNYYFKKCIKYVLNRKNSFNGIVYKNDETIMSWELANEPRPMLKTENENFYLWIKDISSYIKSIDKNHLVTTGVEGSIGTSQDSILFKKIHAIKSIDYATIHIWPKTWQWYGGERTNESTTDTTLKKSEKYIQQHIRWMNELNKPLVIEEFGLHRDNNSFESQTTTSHRDIYYSFIFETLLQSIKSKQSLQGCNFWGFAGYKKNNTIWYQRGEMYSADPPQEEQGLYAVFKTDTSTWTIIKHFTQQLSQK